MGINAIWGPPRSGKTTLAIDLAYALSGSGKSVCLISPELYSELSARLNINIPEQKSLLAAFKTKESLKQVVYRVEELFYVLAVPCFHNALDEETDSDDAKELLKQASILFDVVLVDCPSHTGSVLAAWALNMADKVLLLSGSQTASCLWYNAYRRAVDLVKAKIMPICSETNKNFDYPGLHKLIQITPYIWIPFFKDAEAYLNLKPTLYKSGGSMGRAYCTAINEVCAELEGAHE